MLERNASKRLKGNVQMDDAYIRAPGPSAAGAARNRQDAVRRRYRDNGRWQARSNHPSADQSLQQLCDPKAREHRAQPGRQHRLRRSGMLRRCHPSRMPPHLNQDRKRQASGSHPCFQMGQYRVGQYQSRPCGTYRAVQEKHVPRYLAEFEYRFNRRYDLETMIPRLAFVALRTTPMPYRLLKLADVAA